MTQLNLSISIPQRARWLIPAGIVAVVCALLAPPSIVLLAVATFVSEDLTCVAAGELIRRGQVSALVGVLGCFIGIYTGDLGLWALGRLVGPQVLAWPWVRKRVDRRRVKQLSDWFDRRAPIAVFAARFMPGTRLPVYLGAGLLQGSGVRFALWTFVAAATWTPLVVLAVALAGQRFVAPFERYMGGGWIALASVAMCGAGLIRVGGTLVTRRALLVAKVSRIWRWEFWPMWLFYLPLIPWIAWLTLRHRSFMVITAANPGIPLGGFVGESKLQIMSSIKHLAAVRTTLVSSVDELPMLPAILKPDVGQRGEGVQLVRTIDETREYLRNNRRPTIAQPFHPGPFEAGVFYVRNPLEGRGRIYSITDKIFAELIGDGCSTVEELIWQHPRFRMQAATFLARHADSRVRVLADGERFALVMAGNHCQGTMFCNGAHLITPQLERAIDDIARSFDGFYFGRFDIRYSDVERFKAGEDITVIELNGVTSESTNIYDPCWSLLRAYRTLRRQWKLLFEIGEANVKRGVKPARTRELLRAILDHFRS